MLVVADRRFGTAYLSHFQVSNTSQNVGKQKPTKLSKITKRAKNWIERAEDKVQRKVSESEQQREEFVCVDRQFLAQGKRLL
jgi:lysyl-tRNA synthetase class I